ncbi:hypothetical protein KIN20_004547 [Parelaphostrongylus tenuis]|uniref:Headcase middle domain-containing protein n=1 Tax=Parelaphostrongylus tenuis TaxID=148309 RepID=A0AAD5LYM2_PARTN|nr:hypothetical protein KIN20_004547 [Parelaphostrongylus tenuis]
MIDCGSVFRDRKKSCDSDEFRRRSGSSRSDGKRWGRKDTSGGELRCCIQPDILRSNVDKHWFFEDEQVRVNGSVFARRENFDNLLSIIPMSKFNGIHIKMEDDCPQGGDDVRLCLLKTLGAHNQRVVPCVGCHRDMVVYDRYPLVDGVFFLSPVCHYGPPTEVMYDGKRNYLQQLCASCLWSEWRCNNCGRDGWFNGKSIVLGTLYYYDIVSAGKCCPPTCTVCRSPLLVPENIIVQIVNGNYVIMHELITCSACGSSNYHGIRRMKDFVIRNHRLRFA